MPIGGTDHPIQPNQVTQKKEDFDAQLASLTKKGAKGQLEGHLVVKEIKGKRELVVISNIFKTIFKAIFGEGNTQSSRDVKNATVRLIVANRDWIGADNKDKVKELAVRAGLIAREDDFTNGKELLEVIVKKTMGYKSYIDSLKSMEQPPPTSTSQESNSATDVIKKDFELEELKKDESTGEIKEIKISRFGEVQEGEFDAQKRLIKGKITYPNGRVYEGTFDPETERLKKGKKTYPDVGKEEGDFNVRTGRLEKGTAKLEIKRGKESWTEEYKGWGDEKDAVFNEEGVMVKGMRMLKDKTEEGIFHGKTGELINGVRKWKDGKEEQIGK